MKVKKSYRREGIKCGRKLKYGEPTILVAIRLPLSSANKLKITADARRVSMGEIVNELIKK